MFTVVVYNISLEYGLSYTTISQYFVKMFSDSLCAAIF